jgi:hypothetical protein
MTEFVGRTGALRLYSYPETRRNTTVPFARNFAFATSDLAGTPIETAGTFIPWSAMEAGAPSWSPATTYAIGDRVVFSGTLKTYKSLQNGNLNNQPDVSPLFWEENTEVPITPRSTAIVKISGVVTVKNSSVDQEAVTLQVFVDGVQVAVPFAEVSSIDPTDTPPGFGGLAIPFLTQAEAGSLAVGVTSVVQIKLFATADDVLFIAAESTTIEIEEIVPATA